MELPRLADLIAGLRPKPPVPFAVLYKKFKSILERNNAILGLIGDMGDKLGGDYVFDRRYILDSCERLGDQVFKLVSDLSLLCQRKHVALFTAFERISGEIREELAGRRVLTRSDRLLPLAELTHDLADEGGNKMSSLGDIRNILGFRVPEGFVITAGAYFEAMEQAGLRERAAELGRDFAEGETPKLIERARALREDILAMPLPRGLSKAIVQAAKKLSGDDRALLAARSSAWGEDGVSSFAGMYETVLGVKAGGILDAYRTVLASLFCDQALRYRARLSLAREEPAMAVGVLRMVDASVSGGIYTYAPLPDQDQAMVISAAYGLGKPIVEGVAETDTFILGREPPHETLFSETGRKVSRMGIDPAGGVLTKDVDPELAGAPCLDAGQLAALAKTAMGLERFFRRPLDVEWAFTGPGELVLLQARPLSVRPRACAVRPDVAKAAREAETILAGAGISAMGGVAAGRVHLVAEDADLSDFPYGAILVTRHSSPRFARIMPKCRGIITEVGSATGHMATIARELRVPTLVGVPGATEILRQGEEITLDADHIAVYRGVVEELCRFELDKEDVFEESWEYRTLKRVLKRISPLTLIDPDGNDFTPEKCKTFHDIARYVHQRAVDKLLSLAETHQEIKDGSPRKLNSVLPLGLTVIDVEDGVAPGAGLTIREEDLRSLPMIALFEGLNASGMWETSPVPVGMGSFMSSVTRTMAASQAHPSRLGRNLAVISRQYMNLHLRLGYHFTVVDAFLGESVNDNTILFRFMGGVTDVTRRSRRAELVAAILERFDFAVKIKGDLVTGRVKKHPDKDMLEKMFMLGGLIGFTRQLDALMDSPDSGRRYYEEFVSRMRELKEARK